MFKRLSMIVAGFALFALSFANVLVSASPAPVESDALSVSGFQVRVRAVGSDCVLTTYNLNGNGYVGTDTTLVNNGGWVTVNLNPSSSEPYETFFMVTCPNPSPLVALMAPTLTNQYVTDMGWMGANPYYEGVSQVNPMAYLPWYEGNCDVTIHCVSVFNMVPDAGHIGIGSLLRFVADDENVNLTNVGAVYKRGYDHGYGRGHDKGYEEGVNYGRTSVQNVKQGIYFQWDANYYNSRSFTISWTKVGNASSSLSSNDTLNYYHPTVYFERASDEIVNFSIVTDQGGSGKFGVVYSSVNGSSSTVLDATMLSNGQFYLPFWEGSITLLIVPDSDVGVLNSYDFCIDPVASVTHIQVLSSYANGYNDGWADGRANAASSAYEQGVADGLHDGEYAGYMAGYNKGYEEGVRDGYAQGSSEHTVNVVDIWPLLGSVVSLPFSFFQYGLDWTLFAGTPYEFGVSAFIGSVLVILMLWKIFKLIIGFGK